MTTPTETADETGTDVLPRAAGAATPVEPEPDDLVDQGFDQPPKRSLLTRFLVVCLAVAIGFTAGVGLHRAIDTVQGVPELVGTVQSVTGNVLRVADSSGAVVAVTVPPTATVSTLGLTSLAAGTPVAVNGTKAADGRTLVATAVTARPRRG